MSSRWPLVVGIAALSLGLLAAGAPAEMYKWTDKSGNLHITDYPPPGGGGKPMNLESIRINRVGSGAAGRPAQGAPQSGQGSHPQSAAAPAPRERELPRVEVYGTSWCPACRQARAYFQSAGIPFDDYDVETDKDARARMDRLGGGSGVPAIVIGGRVIRGFSQEWCEAALGIR